jgi:hypothetical protein
MTLLDEIAYQHLDTAQRIYERRGRLLPKIWAQSPERMIVAEPSDQNAITEMTDEFRATLAIAMACRIDALAVGRSDEAYIRASSRDDLKAGALHNIADFDPEVRTCIISEAVMIGGSEEVTLIAIHGLSDSGQHLWDVRESHLSAHPTLVPLQAARNLIVGGLPDFWRDPNALDQFANQIGWKLRLFPEPVE